MKRDGSDINRLSKRNDNDARFRCLSFDWRADSKRVIFNQEKTKSYGSYGELSHSFLITYSNNVEGNDLRNLDRSHWYGVTCSPKMQIPNIEN